jgi:hypothetical protein
MLSEFIKLNLFVIVRDRGNCERFAFRFETKTNISETGAPYPEPSHWGHLEFLRKLEEIFESKD